MPPVERDVSNEHVHDVGHAEVLEPDLPSRAEPAGPAAGGTGSSSGTAMPITSEEAAQDREPVRPPGLDDLLRQELAIAEGPAHDAVAAPAGTRRASSPIASPRVGRSRRNDAMGRPVATTDGRSSRAARATRRGRPPGAPARRPRPSAPTARPGAARRGPRAPARPALERDDVASSPRRHRAGRRRAPPGRAARIPGRRPGRRSLSTCAGSGLDRTTVTRSRSSPTIPRSSPRATGSRAETGSSSRRTSGSPISACARPSRRRSARSYERGPGIREDGQPDARQHRGHPRRDVRPGDPGELGRERQLLPPGHPFEDRIGVGEQPNLPPELHAVAVVDRDAGDDRRAARGPNETGEQPERRRPCPSRSRRAAR